jgi:hypothetical protein
LGKEEGTKSILQMIGVSRLLRVVDRLWEITRWWYTAEAFGPILCYSFWESRRFLQSFTRSAQSTDILTKKIRKQRLKMNLQAILLRFLDKEAPG